MTVLLHKRGTGVPTADAFHSVGEILIDTSTGMAYTLTDAGTVVALTGSHYTGADAVKLTGDQTVAGHKTYSDVATFTDTVIARGNINGDATANFQGAVSASEFVGSGAKLTGVAADKVTKGEPNIIGTKGLTTYSTYGFGGPEYFLVACGEDGTYDSGVSLGNGSFKWNVIHAKYFYKDGSPMIAAEELVDVFTTLRRAIDDEDTAEGVKQALSNALGGLIEKFEAMNDDG